MMRVRRAGGARPVAAVDDPYAALAPYYDLIAPPETADIALYAAFARRLAAPVLELGVGTGRVAVALARLGFRVVGIDVSPSMLAVARARAEAAGVTVELHQADACAYRFAERFGLIFSAADSFLHVGSSERHLRALRLAGEHLAADGRLVIDLPAPGGSWADWQAGVRPLELVWSGPAPEGGLLQYFVTFSVDAAAQERVVTHLLDHIGPDGIVRRRQATHRLRFIFPAELALLVEAAGLRLIDRYGDYELGPFQGGCERMIAVIGPRRGEDGAVEVG
jgi:SAM-dependent methyltransferase